MKRTDVYIDDELMEWIEEKAKKEHVRVSVMLRKLLWKVHDEEINA